MNCLIVEDEKIAAARLMELVKQCDPECEIVATLQSVKQAVHWFEANPPPDLVFLDIQLADGLSFEIFEKTRVEAPVIFTTAYEEYALQAFKVNSIDYLLKPIEPEALCTAMERYRKSPYAKEPGSYSSVVFDRVLQSLSRKYKSKFVIKVADRIRIVPVSEVSCFYSLEKATFLQSRKSRDYAINYSLDDLEGLLDPELFFRISRKYLVAQAAITDITVYSSSRLLLELESHPPDEVVVSRDRVQEFKQWLEG